MLPDQNSLKRFLKAKMNFFVYGPRASGKTTLLKKVFEEVKTQYIYMNCTMGDKKTNFFRYLNHELDKFFKRKIREQQEKSKALGHFYQKPPDPTSVHAWIQNIKNLSLQVREYLQNIYFFIDNIEQIHVSANFMTTFFSACQQNTIDDFKIPFVFCGITLPKKIYAVDKPFRNIISFCMKKPVEVMKQVIERITLQVFQKKFNQGQIKNRFTPEDVRNACSHLANQIYHAFEPMQADLNRIKKMTYILALQIGQRTRRQMTQEQSMKVQKKVRQRNLQKRINSKINNGDIKVLTREMLQLGPVADFMIDRKVNKDIYNEQNNVELPYEYYPNLIMTSLHLADLAAETEDKRRFQDYKKQKGRSVRNLEMKIGRHNLQRIIAISEVLESVGKKDGPEFQLNHHSLNYYACFQFLREQQKIFVQGKNSTFASTKIHGDTKQQQARTFLKAKMDANYLDYAPRVDFKC